MDWCLQEATDDFSVLSYQDVLEDLCAEDISLSPADWFNWTSTGSGKAESPNRYCRKSIKSCVQEFTTDAQNLYLQVSNGPSIYQDGGSNSKACPEPSLADCHTRASEASSSAKPDYQLQHGVDWMDEIFLNSFLQEDFGNMENPLESLNMADSIYRSLSSENLLSNMLRDSESLMNDAAKRETSISTVSFPLFTNDISETWGRTADSQPSCLMTEEPKRSESLAMDHVLELFYSTELSASNEHEAVSDMDEPKCLEEIALHELEDTMIQLDDRTRICFRDALYRLATTSKEQTILNQIKSVNFIDGARITNVDDGTLRMGRAGHEELKTNVIDRTIANLMFNKPCYVSPDLSCTGSLQIGMENFASPGLFYSLRQPEQSHFYCGPT